MGAAEGYLQGIDDYTVIKMCTIGEKSVLIDSLISVSLNVSLWKFTNCFIYTFGSFSFFF